MKLQPGYFEPTEELANYRDTLTAEDSLRLEYYIPKIEGLPAIYFCGNSLGLQPVLADEYVKKEMVRWRELAVDGHFKGDPAWTTYHQEMGDLSAPLVGAKPSEVVIMNTLTVNLHLMLVSFYRPQKHRYKIIVEAGAFPSDQYAVETQVRFYAEQHPDWNMTPENAIVEVQPLPGETTIRTSQFLEALHVHRDEVALVLLGGVHYYTGQLHDLATITHVAKNSGVTVGLDLAHAAGNVPLQLHGWGVDFAVWCCYKYLNGGPGGPGGVFIHEKHHRDPDIQRFAGWWGYEESTRFLMRKGFTPIPNAQGWQLSNASIFSFAAHRASLELFTQRPMSLLRERSILLTAYLEHWIRQLQEEGLQATILTPSEYHERGCQLSLYIAGAGKSLHQYLLANRVICDWREDNLSGTTGGVIRLAPTPMYNTFREIMIFARLLRSWMKGNT